MDNQAEDTAGIAVLGLGYVGCVTAACLAQIGHRVVGVDRDQHKVDSVLAGHSPFFEPDLEGMARFGFHLLSGGVSLASTKVTEFGVYSTFATQVLFLVVGVDSRRFSPIYFLTFVLLILPAVLNKRRRQPTRMPPWLTYLWLLPVIVPAAADVLLRTRLLYYPRAYIATTPLLRCDPSRQ